MYQTEVKPISGFQKNPPVDLSSWAVVAPP